ncbi:hypothetical protein ACFLR7_04495, partial [Acidobacteriota bacterium]
MPNYTSETQRWIELAEKAKKPYAKLYNNGTLVLSVIRDGNLNIRDVLVDDGYVCLRAVDEIRSRRLKLNVKPRWKRIKFDPSEPGIVEEELDITLEIPEPHFEADSFQDVDHSCRISVNNSGHEEVRSICKGIRERLTSRFFADLSQSRKGNTDMPKQKNVVQQKKRTQKKKESSMKNETIGDVVIITSLPLETEAVLRHLPNPEEIVSKPRRYYKSIIAHENSTFTVILCSLSGMGNVKAAVAATQAIDVWNPQYLILTGIAGGVKKELGGNLGDIIIGEQFVGYEPGKLNDRGIDRRFEVHRPDFSLLQRARNLSKDQWIKKITAERPGSSKKQVFPDVHFGVVASGEKVIKSVKFSDEMQSSWSKLIGVEMESFGIAQA